MIGLSRNNICIGIDLGTLFIKAVEVEMGLAGEATLRKACVVARADGLKKAVSGMHLNGAKVIVALDCPMTCVRYITVPIMPEKELAEAVKWEAKDKIPFSIDEAEMDYEVQKEIEEDGVKKLRIKIAVTPKKTAEDILTLLNQAGIEPASLMPAPLALEYLTTRLGLKKDEAVAVIDIGLDSTEVNIVKDDLLIFNRKISSGGSSVTKAMTGVFISERGQIELGCEEAERIKIKYGMPSETTADLIEGKVSPTHLISLIRPAAERLFRDIERSIEYYRDESAGDTVKSVVLFGGGSKLRGVTEFLQVKLGVPVSNGEPFKAVRVLKGAVENADTESNLFDIALGAALSAGKGINLLPRRLKERTLRSFENAAAEGVVAAVIMALILTFIGMRIQSANYDKRITAGLLEMKTIAPQVETASECDILRSQIAERQALMERISVDTPRWEEVFKEISNKLPTEAVLSEMDMSNNELILKGQLSAAPEARETALSNLIAALEGGIFRNISLINANMKNDATAKTEFQIKCTF